MKIVQVNVDRSKRATDPLRQKCEVDKLDFAIIAEPNTNMVKNSLKWVTDKYLDSAIYISQDKIKTRKSGGVLMLYIT